MQFPLRRVLFVMLADMMNERGPAMTDNITFSAEERSELESRLQEYLTSELNLDVTSFDAGFLLDFIVGDLGRLFYNKGVYDAAARLSTRIDSISDEILALEKR